MYCIIGIAIAVIIAIMYWPDFITVVEFQKVAQRAPYLYTMSGPDLVARGCTDAASYRELYIESARPWNIHECFHMWRVAHDAERGLRRVLTTRIPDYTPVIKWRFAKLARGIEMNYPHTHEDVIVWNEANLDEPRDTQVNLAVHEMVHILQRRDPEVWTSLYKKLGYTRSVSDVPLRRNNPDTVDTWNLDGVVSVAQYRSHQPENLSDVDAADHPAETVAYEIAAAI